MNVIIEIIPHDQQRYPTVGDWFYKWRLKCPQCTNQELVQANTTTCPRCQYTLGPNDVTKTALIRVSKLSDVRKELLVAVHELVELVDCETHGVTQEEVDAFDKEFEANRQEGDLSEPGDHRDAPYYAQHQKAMAIERATAVFWGVDWETYAAEIEALP